MKKDNISKQSSRNNNKINKEVQQKITFSLDFFSYILRHILLVHRDDLMVWKLLLNLEEKPF